jgi:hypothetical protein
MFSKSWTESCLLVSVSDVSHQITFFFAQPLPFVYHEGDGNNSASSATDDWLSRCMAMSNCGCWLFWPAAVVATAATTTRCTGSHRPTSDSSHRGAEASRRPLLRHDDTGGNETTTHHVVVVVHIGLVAGHVEHARIIVDNWADFVRASRYAIALDQLGLSRVAARLDHGRFARQSSSLWTIAVLDGR